MKAELRQYPCRCLRLCCRVPGAVLHTITNGREGPGRWLDWVQFLLEDGEWCRFWLACLLWALP